MTRLVEDALTDARSRTSPWDADRSARVLSGALAGRASLVRRRSIVRRGIALASGAVLVAFAFRAVAFSPSSHEAGGHEAAHEQAQELAQGPTQDRAMNRIQETHALQPLTAEEAQLASRALNDAGYGTD